MIVCACRVELDRIERFLGQLSHGAKVPL
jgi:hypothetical protein